MAPRTIKIEHLYHDYDLYSATFSRPPSYKLGEALSAVFTMHELQRISANGFSSFAIMEILAGRSEHKDNIRTWASNLDIRDYVLLDSECESDECIKGDALDADFSQHDVNLIFGFFFSASSVVDLSGKHRDLHARTVVADLYKNMYRNLPKIGAFSLDFASNGYIASLCSPEGEHTEVLDVPFYSKLRATYGLPAWGKCTVTMHRYATYDRLTSTTIYLFSKPIVIHYEGDVVARIQVKQPMTQRYFSEPELVDMALDAGFSRVMLLKNNYAENDFEVLPRFISLADDELLDNDDVPAYMGNTIVALKGVADDSYTG